MGVPNQRERQVMQRLRGGDWLKAIELPMGQRLFKTLLDKEWIVQEIPWTRQGDLRAPDGKGIGRQDNTDPARR